jgi:hypothetical protein
MADLIQFRRDTSANWTSSNPILANGEFGYETNTGKGKVGNGTTAWNNLSYSFFSGTGNLVAGTGVTLSGDLVDRLVGTGDVTINATATGGIGGTIASNQVAYGSGSNNIAGSSSLTYNDSTKLMTLDGTHIANNFRSTQQTVTLAAGATFDPTIPAGTNNIISIIATNQNISYLTAIVTKLGAVSTTNINTIQANNIGGSLVGGELRITNNSGQSLDLVINLLCLNRL